jgi:hypothetical protein
MYAEVKSTAVASNPHLYLDRDTATRTRSIARWWEAQRAAHRPAVAEGKARKPLR